MVVLCRRLSREQANAYALALAAEGIECSLDAGPEGWYVQVWIEDYEAALAAVTAYDAENQPSAAAPSAPAAPLRKTYSGGIVAALLAVIYLLVTQTVGMDSAAYQWGAAAQRILDGQWYRTVTALMLHRDLMHLLGNMAAIALLGSVVASLRGNALGWALILYSGMIGNFLNAWVTSPGHLSIGASTAIFGAVGILAGVQFMSKLDRPEQRFRAWVPLAGGLALLGWMGSGAHTDLGAHLFGFVAGLGLGVGDALLGKRADLSRYRAWSGLAAAVTIAAAWGVALR